MNIFNVEYCLSPRMIILQSTFISEMNEEEKYKYSTFKINFWTKLQVAYFLPLYEKDAIRV